MTITPQIAEPVWWFVGDEDIRILWYGSVHALKVAILDISHKEWYAVEMQSLDGAGSATEIVNVIWQTFYVCIAQAAVMVASDEDFVLVGQVTEPVDEVHCLLRATTKRDVARVDYDVRWGQVCQLGVLAVSIREMEEGHVNSNNGFGGR